MIVVAYCMLCFQFVILVVKLGDFEVFAISYVTFDKFDFVGTETGTFLIFSKDDAKTLDTTPLDK